MAPEEAPSFTRSSEAEGQTSQAPVQSGSCVLKAESSENSCRQRRASSVKSRAPKCIM